MRGVYTVKQQITVSAAITLLQIKAGASIVVELLRAHISKANTETDDSCNAQILRKTAAATVTSFTPLKYENGDQAAASVGGTAATGHTASVEGTDGDVLVDEGFSILAGWTWLPTPEERIYVPPAGIIALKSSEAITSTDLICSMVFREIG